MAAGQAIDPVGDGSELASYAIWAFTRRGGSLAAGGLEPAERLDCLVVGAADADFVAGDSLDFVGEGELVADFERAREGVVFEACDTEETPPVKGKQVDLLRLGFGFRMPTSTRLARRLSKSAADSVGKTA